MHTRHRRPFLVRRLGDEPGLRLRVEAAERLGISLRRFDGWEPTTRYRHRKGRLVSSTPESEWDDEQRAWVLAMETWRSNRCPNCGRDIAECTGTEDWTVPPPRRCHVTTALAIARKPYEKNPQPESLLWRVQRAEKG